MSATRFQLPCGCLVVVGAEFDTTEPCPVHVTSNAPGEAIMAAFLCDVLRPGAPYPEELQAALGMTRASSANGGTEQ
jgi:hypothetical protein